MLGREAALCVAIFSAFIAFLILASIWTYLTKRFRVARFAVPKDVDDMDTETLKQSFDHSVEVVQISTPPMSYNQHHSSPALNYDTSTINDYSEQGSYTEELPVILDTSLCERYRPPSPN